MPKIIDGDFPKYLFESKEEMRAFFEGEVMSRLSNKLAKRAAIGVEDTPARVMKHFATALAKDIEGIWDFRHRDGSIGISGFNNTCDATAYFMDRRYALQVLEPRLRPKPSAAAETRAEVRAAETKVARVSEGRAAGASLKLGGVAIGGLMTVHGAVAAATAVSAGPQGRKTRDWKKTAVHTVEAVAGIGLCTIAGLSLSKSSALSR